MAPLSPRRLGLLGLFIILLTPGAARAQNWTWAAAPTPAATTKLQDVRNAVDASGNEYVAATFYGAVTIGTMTLTSPGGNSTFVAKRSAAGVWLWATQGGAGTVSGLGVDGSGNAYVSVQIQPTGATFGSTVFPDAGNASRAVVAKVSAAGQWQWATAAIGSSSSTLWGTRLAVDAGGNAYLAGTIQMTVAFGAATLTSAGHEDAFVAKLNTSGVWQWAARAGGSGSSDAVSGVATDAAGNVYVTGYFNSSSASFGSITLPNSSSVLYDRDVFVAKLSPTGSWLWAVNRGIPGFDDSNLIAVTPTGDIRLTRFVVTANGSGGSRMLVVERLTTSGVAQWTLNARAGDNVSITGMAVDAGGATYLAGCYTGTEAAFGTTTLPAPPAWGWYSSDALVAKVTATGGWEWAVRGTGAANDQISSLALDAAGLPRVAGSLASYDAAFGTIPVTAIGTTDAFLAQLDAAGTWQAASRLGSATGASTSKAVARDAAGNTYVTGRFRGTLTFGTRVLTSTGGSTDVFVAKLGPTGTWLWAVRAGGAGDDIGTGIAVTSTGVVYVTGSFAGPTATFNTTVLPNGGATDVFVAKLTTTGSWSWAKGGGGAGADAATDIALDASGNAYLTGTFSGTGTFGTLALSSAGSSDAFVAKLSSAGAWTWALRGGGSGGATEGRGIAVSGSSVYVTGNFLSPSAGFGATTLTNAGTATRDIFLARLTTAGAWTWAQRGGGTGGDWVTDVGVDGSGNAYLAGYFTSQTPTFGTFTLSNTTIGSETGYEDHYDVFVAKVSATGSWTWVSQAGMGQDCTYLRPAAGGGGTPTPQKEECESFKDMAFGLAVDATGNAYIVGSSDSWYGPNVVGPVLPGTFVAALAPAGAWQWVMAINAWSNNADWPGAAAIAVDPNGVPVLAGCIGPDAAFNATTLRGATYADIPFVAQLAPNAPPIPAVNSFTPTAGYTGTVVTINGANLTGATSVKFNGTAASAFTVVSATQVTATVAAGTTTGPISITTPGGTATSYSSFLMVAPPTITGFTPASGPVGSLVVITGTNFGPNAISALGFNGRNSSATVNSPTQITTTVPSGATTGPITVTNAGGTAQSATSFTVTGAVVTGFSPASGPAGSSVIVTGSNFTGATSVKFNGQSATFTVNSPTQLTAVVPATATTGKISVTANGGTDQSSASFRVVPTITSFSPSAGGLGTSVTITGTGFTGAYSVLFGGSAGISYAVTSPTTIVATVNQALPTGPILVYTGGGYATSAGSFSFVVAPTITSFTPIAGATASIVTITGTNFTGATAVTFGGVAAPGFTVNSATSITVAVPANAGTGPISVTTPGGTATSTGTFTPTSPGVSSITPTAGWVTARVTINGAGLSGATAVKFNGANAASFTVNATGTAITVYVPTAATTGFVTVTTPTGTIQSLEIFNVVPRIISFAPVSGPAGSSVVLNGTGFSPTAANNVVYFGGSRAAVTAATLTRLTVTVPPGAAYGPPTVTVGGRTGTALQAFALTFGGGGVPTATSFGARATVGTGAAPTALAVGDLDGDGKPDLVVANRNANTISLLRNTATSGALTGASFAARLDVATGLSPRGLTLADLDGDGRLDVVVANKGDNTVTVLRNQMTAPGAFTAASLAAGVAFAAGNGPVAVTAGDIDLDGRPDIVVADSVGLTLTVLANQAAPGVLTAASLGAKVDFATGSAAATDGYAVDLNGDARADVLGTFADGGGINVWKSLATTPGPLSAASLGAAGFLTGNFPQAVRPGDVDGDGKADVVFSSPNGGKVGVLRNTATTSNAPGSWLVAAGQYTPPAPVPAGCLALGDLDGGGKVDVVGAMPLLNGVAIFSNRSVVGTPTLGAAAVTVTTGQRPQGVVVADLDGDGRPDLATADYRDNTVSLLRNQVTGSTVTAFAPASGPVGTVVTITGTNLADAATVTFGGGVVAPATVLSATQVRATVPTGATTGSLRVSLATGPTATSAATFTVSGPRPESPTEAGGAAALTLALHPNPAKGLVYLLVSDRAAWTTAADIGPVVVMLLDARGQILRRQPVPQATAEIPLDLTALPAGLYLVQVVAANGAAATGRLVVE